MKNKHSKRFLSLKQEYVRTLTKVDIGKACPQGSCPFQSTTATAAQRLE